jgi:hypothetical protein
VQVNLTNMPSQVSDGPVRTGRHPRV